MINNLGFSAASLPPPIVIRGLIHLVGAASVVHPVAVGMQIGGNGNDVINIGTQIPGPPGPPGPPGLVPVTVVTVSPFTATLADYYLAVDVPIPASIILPVSPTGAVFIVKDVDGDASINPIAVTALGALIDGAASATINTNFGAVQLIFNGVEWSIV